MPIWHPKQTILTDDVPATDTAQLTQRIESLSADTSNYNMISVNEADELADPKSAQAYETEKVHDTIQILAAHPGATPEGTPLTEMMDQAQQIRSYDALATCYGTRSREATVTTQVRKAILLRKTRAVVDQVYLRADQPGPHQDSARAVADLLRQKERKQSAIKQADATRKENRARTDREALDEALAHNEQLLGEVKVLRETVAEMQRQLALTSRTDRRTPNR